jgi:hypothetical protein
MTQVLFDTLEVILMVGVFYFGSNLVFESYFAAKERYLLRMFSKGLGDTNGKN